MAKPLTFDISRFLLYLYLKDNSQQGYKPKKFSILRTPWDFLFPMQYS